MNRFIKRLSEEISLVGNYTESGNLWCLHLVNTAHGQPAAAVTVSEGELPFRMVEEMMGFKAVTYVNLGLDRHYSVNDPSGKEVYRASLT
jgi:hypothetical protein